MKNFYLTLFFSIISLSTISAQHINKSKLIGSWRLSYLGWDDKKEIPKREEILSFYKHDIFQEKFSYPPDFIELTTDTLQAGNWKLNPQDSFILFSNRHKIPHKPMDPSYFEDSMYVALLNDSVLEVIPSFSDGVIYHYSRISTLPQIKDVRLPYIPIPDTTAKTSFFLINSADTSRKIELKTEDFGHFPDIGVTYRDTTADTLFSITTTVDGNLYQLMPDSIWVTDITSENVSTYYIPEKYNPEDFGDWGYKSATYSGAEKLGRKIKLSSIQQIYYSSPQRTNRFGFGGALLGFSCFEILVVSPLVSIKYREGGFDSRQYFTWAGIGLCGVGVSIPLLAFNHTKRYFITEKNKKSDKNYWYLEKQFLN
jgi:hypothetical protein